MHRLGHAVEDHNALSATSGRERLTRRADTTVYILPIVHRPDIACRIDSNIGQHLQTPSHVAVWGRYLPAGMYAGRAVLRAHAAQLHNRTTRPGEIGDPDVVVAIHGNGPRARQTAALERRARIWRSVRPQHRDAATVDGASLLLRHRFR